MKKIYTTPEVIVHGTVENITKMGQLPWHPIFNPGGRKDDKGGS